MQLKTNIKLKQSCFQKLQIFFCTLFKFRSIQALDLKNGYFHSLDLKTLLNFLLR
jgi:hypothetical protein